MEEEASLEEHGIPPVVSSSDLVGGLPFRSYWFSLCVLGQRFTVWTLARVDGYALAVCGI